MLKDYDDKCRAIHDELVEDFETTVRDVIDLGIAEGFLGPASTVDAIVPHLLGPLTFNVQHDRPMDEAFVDDVLERFLAGEAQRLAATTGIGR